MREIYLDNAATTRVCPAACEKVLEMMSKNFGNPSSVHTKGVVAWRDLQEARKTVAAAAGFSPEDVIFTSGGTEANNLAIFGVAARLKKGARILTSAIEHSSVFEPMTQLKSRGFDVVFLQPNETGHIDQIQFARALTPNTGLASFALVTNELGSIFPAQELKLQMKKLGIFPVLHIDAAQAFGKLDVSKFGADLLTISGHKVHGPKGVGALCKRRGVRISPVFFGGGQEIAVRPGTEAVPGICGFAAAVRLLGDINKNWQNVIKLNSHCRKKLARIPNVVVNSGENSSPYILNFSCVGLFSEVIVNFLSQRQIFVSNGAACAKGQNSWVLKACNLPKARIDGAIRVSFCSENTVEDVDALCEALMDAMKNLVKR